MWSSKRVEDTSYLENFDLVLGSLYWIEFKQVISLGGKRGKRREKESEETEGNAKKRILWVSLESFSASLRRGISLVEAFLG